MESSRQAGSPSSILPPSSSALLERLHSALGRATDELLAGRTADGHWEGELSSSALSTATAVIALAIGQRESKAQSQQSQAGLASACEIQNFKCQISKGLNWLAEHVNADGGWGDTIQSLSNLSTTALCWAAFGAVLGADEEYRPVVRRAEAWLACKTDAVPYPRITDPPGHHDRGASHAPLVTAIVERYGKDRTFSVPILTACALAGRLGPGRGAWRWVLPLPFELAALPRHWFAALRLPVVSYALPALIAIGQARHHHLPSRNPAARLARMVVRERTLKILTEIQPSSGGFLEATPLTSFVVMSLAGSGQVAHPVTRRGGEFLLKAQRADGSWPIDTNLATWLTTLAVNAISNFKSQISDSLKARSAEWENGDWETNVCRWLLGQQYRQTHPYTQAAPGGWAWTDLAGGVPDADDTAGAVLALSRFRSADGGRRNGEILAAARAGIKWLREVQNRDGGIPTFCRGWGALPFDRSSADITAHAIRCWLAWLDDLPQDERRRTVKALRRAVGFLGHTQRPDGAWTPLWFGNQFAPNEENLTYGTAEVLCALPTVLVRKETKTPLAALLYNTAVAWLVRAQNADGGWGGSPGIVSSVEETAVAVEALASAQRSNAPEATEALKRGVNWLIERVENGGWTQPTPIGFYFARLWYYEKLYPQIFTVGALGRAAREWENGEELKTKDQAPDHD